MIIRGRAPLRLGLAGGGTDVSPYCDEYGGAVLNVTIDKYAYASVEEPHEPGALEFHSPDREMIGRSDHAAMDELSTDFALHVAVYRRMIDQFNDGTPVPMRLVTQVDAPPGSGLGSSSTVVVAMVAVVAERLKLSLGQYEMAELAWQIERQDLGFAGGWQDQYAATFGGFNFIESEPGGRIVVNPLRVRRSVKAELEASLLLYFGGVSRDSAEVISRQQANVRRHDAASLEATHAVRREARTMKQHLLVGDVPAMAGSLRDGWEAKKRLAPGISTTQIEEAYDVAARHGMVAGKISGAGGGGFMMMIVDPSRRLDVMRNLAEECGGTVSTCHFTETGVETWNSRAVWAAPSSDAVTT